MIKQFWQGLGRKERAGMLAGAVFIIAASLAAGLWAFRTDYQVVFADLAPADAALMVAELERMKVPYRLGEGGAAILVDRDIAHKTRIKLMGKNLPLHGAVGFELFNSADFGMSEFAQKVNYQRALQGELTRTILSLSEIQDARVHLVLPDEGLFKRAQTSAKASVTLALKPGRRLLPEQISGIQRLVSAAVPGIAVQDVTLIDQDGLALSRSAMDEAGAEMRSTRLDLKKETENHLARKANEVLERAFGRTQALVSVDVMLNLDQVRSTTENVLAAPAAEGQAQTGVITRERDVTQEGSAPLDRASADGRRLASGSSQHEVEYSVGRRVEHIVTAPGSIRRLQVVAVLGKSLGPSEIEPVRELLAAAVGASKERGDTVVVYAFDGLGKSATPPDLAGWAGKGAAEAPALAGDRAGSALAGASGADVSSMPAHLVAACLIAIIAGVLMGLAWRKSIRSASVRARPLNGLERQIALAEVRQSLRVDAAANSSSDPEAQVSKVHA